MNALLAFFLGQLSLALLIFAFIKFFIFGEAPPLSTTTTRRTRRPSQPLLRASALRHKPSSLLPRPAPPIAPSTILAKTFYNVAGHQPESLDWFNVLVAQTLAHLRAEALHDDAVLKTATEVLNGPQKPDFLGAIRVTEMALGDEFPIFSNCRIIPVDEAGVAVKSVGEGTRLLARLDVDLSDAITLGVESTLVLNYPRPVVAVLPVALAVSVVRFSGTLSISFIPADPPPTPPSTDPPPKDVPAPGPGPTTLAFSFLPDYRLDLSVRSLVGSRSRLQDVPKIAQLVEARIHAWLDERCVEPRVQQIVLPGLWPRKRNTRGGGEGDEEEEVGDDEGGAEGQGGGGDAERGAGGGLEARMAAEGKKLLASEGREPRGSGRGTTADDDNDDHREGVRRRNTPLRENQSTENMRIPGQFD